MKSTEFILEARMDPVRPAKWAKLLKRDCQPYIQEMKGKPISKFPLYRGMHEKIEFIKKSVRLENRNSVDTKPDIHLSINKYFEKNYGAPFRNAMFCTGSVGVTERYGDLYVVFPIGEFQYVWSFKIDDLFPKVHHEINNNADFSEHELNDLLDYGNYQTSKLSLASKEGVEIMIRCKEYYAIAYSSVKGMETEIEKYII